jgi:cytochrome c peroxidase
MKQMGSGTPHSHAHLLACVVTLLSILVISARAQSLREKAQMIDSLVGELPVGLGALPDPPIPADNQQTPQKVGLGKRLFFDKALSADRSISCGSCHDPKKGLSDGRPHALGFHGTVLRRHTPSIWNAAYNASQFWDGRADTLEDQATGPMSSPGEMNSPGERELMKRLEADPYYRGAFPSVFGESLTLRDVAKALAAFERTLIAKNSRFDRYARGDKRALTLHEKNGLVVFIGKGRCARCHNGLNFTDNKFQNIGVGQEDDKGRFAVTAIESDRGAFKTPSLRNVELHAPYMHDGSVPTLEAVIDYYDRGGDSRPGKSPFVMKIGLTVGEKRDVLAFLKALTDKASPIH